APRLSETWTVPWSLTDPTEDVADDPAAPDPGPTEVPDETTTEEVAPTADATTEDATMEEVATESLVAPADLTTTAAPQPTEPGGPGASGEVVRSASPGAGTASWIWVSNPGEDAAAVTVTLHTPDGPVVPDIGDELLVEPGQVLRVDLRGLLPPGQSAAGATV